MWLDFILLPQYCTHTEDWYCIASESNRVEVQRRLLPLFTSFTRLIRSFFKWSNSRLAFIQAPLCEGYSCTEGRPIRPNNNWLCPLIGGFPSHMPVGQQTPSKIANWTGLKWFKILTVCGWSCRKWLLLSINDSHLAGRKDGGGGEWPTPGQIHLYSDRRSLLVPLCGLSQFRRRKRL